MECVLPVIFLCGSAIFFVFCFLKCRFAVSVSLMASKRPEGTIESVRTMESTCRQPKSFCVKVSVVCYFFFFFFLSNDSINLFFLCSLPPFFFRDGQAANNWPLLGQRESASPMKNGGFFSHLTAFFFFKSEKGFPPFKCIEQRQRERESWRDALLVADNGLCAHHLLSHPVVCILLKLLMRNDRLSSLILPYTTHLIPSTV